MARGQEGCQRRPVRSDPKSVAVREKIALMSAAFGLAVRRVRSKAWVREAPGAVASLANARLRTQILRFAPVRLGHRCGSVQSDAVPSACLRAGASWAWLGWRRK